MYVMYGRIYGYIYIHACLYIYIYMYIYIYIYRGLAGIATHGVCGAIPVSEFSI